MEKFFDKFTTLSSDDICILHEVLDGYLRALESTSSDHKLTFMDQTMEAETIHKKVSGVNDKIISILMKVNYGFDKSNKKLH